MGCSPRVSKFQFSLKCSCVKKCQKYEKYASNDGESQITMAAPEVNSQPQEASGGALEPPSPQEPKLQGGAPRTRRDEKNIFFIQTGAEGQRQK